jgi:hypothetical protein
MFGSGESMGSRSLILTSIVSLYQVCPSTRTSPRVVTECLCTGAAAALVDTVEKFGSGTLELSEILDPAIRLAEDG